MAKTLIRIITAVAAALLGLTIFATPAVAAEPQACFLGVCWGDETSSPAYQPEADLCDWWVQCKKDRTVCDAGLFSPCDKSDPSWNHWEQLAPNAKQRSAAGDDCTLEEILLGAC